MNASPWIILTGLFLSLLNISTFVGIAVFGFQGEFEITLTLVFIFLAISACEFYLLGLIKKAEND